MAAAVRCGPCGVLAAGAPRVGADALGPLEGALLGRGPEALLGRLPAAPTLKSASFLNDFN